MYEAAGNAASNHLTGPWKCCRLSPQEVTLSSEPGALLSRMVMVVRRALVVMVWIMLLAVIVGDYGDDGGARGVD